MWEQVEVLKNHAHFPTYFINVFYIVIKLNSVDNNIPFLMLL